jgi:hypothetical protein
MRRKNLLIPFSGLDVFPDFRYCVLIPLVDPLYLLENLENRKFIEREEDIGYTCLFSHV